MLSVGIITPPSLISFPTKAVQATQTSQPQPSPRHATYLLEERLSSANSGVYPLHTRQETILNPIPQQFPCQSLLLHCYVVLMSLIFIHFETDGILDLRYGRDVLRMLSRKVSSQKLLSRILVLDEDRSRWNGCFAADVRPETFQSCFVADGSVPCDVVLLAGEDHWFVLVCWCRCRSWVGHACGLR